MRNSNIDPTSSIHEKLKSNNRNCWAYWFATTSEDNANYLFKTKFTGGVEHAVYERIDDGFVIVDFFTSYETASKEAKEIIDKCPDIKSSWSNKCQESRHGK